MSTQVPQRCPFEGEGGGEWCQCPEGKYAAQRRALDKEKEIFFVNDDHELPTCVYSLLNIKSPQCRGGVYCYTASESLYINIGK